MPKITLKGGQEMLKLIDIDAEEYYNNAIQKMEIACGEPLYPGDERRVFTEALIAVLVQRIP